MKVSRSLLIQFLDQFQSSSVGLYQTRGKPMYYFLDGRRTVAFYKLYYYLLACLKCWILCAVAPVRNCTSNVVLLQGYGNPQTRHNRYISLLGWLVLRTKRQTPWSRVILVKQVVCSGSRLQNQKGRYRDVKVAMILASASLLHSVKLVFRIAFISGSHCCFPLWV